MQLTHVLHDNCAPRVGTCIPASAAQGVGMATAKKQQQQRRQQTSAALCEFSQSTCVHLSGRQFHGMLASMPHGLSIDCSKAARTLTVVMQPAMVASVCAGGTSMRSDDPLDHHSHYSYYCNCHYSVRRGACVLLCTVS